MRFLLFSAALLDAATVSHAALLQHHESFTKMEPYQENLAQVNAFVSSEAQNENLVDALSKVISSLSTDPPAGGAPAAAPAAPAAEVVKVGDVKRPAGKKNPAAGTNIAITTAMDQHINIFVPEDPDGKVTVKKTEGVKIVESDSDKADKNADVKKAIGDKIKGKLVKKAMRDDDSEDSADAGKGKKDKKKSKHHKLAQTAAVPMTEDEILALSQVDADSESEVDSEIEAESEGEVDAERWDNSPAPAECKIDMKEVGAPTCWDKKFFDEHNINAEKAAAQVEADSDSDSESEGWLYDYAQVDSQISTSLYEEDIMQLA